MVYHPCLPRICHRPQFPYQPSKTTYRPEPDTTMILNGVLGEAHYRSENDSISNGIGIEPVFLDLSSRTEPLTMRC